jgi:isopenicillin N synthase-like dioxygenase
MKDVPKVDLKNFISGDANKKIKFINNIGSAFSEIGFVRVKGHFLNKELVENLYDQIQGFFKLPQKEKEKYEINGLGGQRGYTSFGKEHAKGRKVGDLKEFWHFGQEVDNIKETYPANIKVIEMPFFNEIGLKTFKMLEETGKQILRALAIYLNLDEFYFDEFIYNGNSILRAIHYPPIVKEPKDAIRAAAHGDINLITLLMGAQGEGLQLKTNQGKWIDAIAQPDELMINIGDMLSRLTNNRLKSTFHRVVNPDRNLWGKSRYSIPFFMHPIQEMPLNCLPSCFSLDNPKKYTDITAETFLNKRLKEIGLVKN